MYRFLAAADDGDVDDGGFVCQFDGPSKHEILEKCPLSLDEAEVEVGDMVMKVVDQVETMLMIGASSR
jgi:hypothetical protein